MQEITVRKYAPSDHGRARLICKTTATGAQYKRHPDMLYALFCDCYLEQPSGGCFVAANKNDEAVGYILFAPDWKEFIADFAPYLRRVRRSSLSEYIVQSVYLRLMRRHFGEYPAHLHIDILPEYQGKGIGRKLMTALIEHLKEQGVRGLLLTVGADNKGGIAFYERMGFTRIRSLAGLSYVYAMTFFYEQF